jgi:HlyD family secretion protein
VEDLSMKKYMAAGVLVILLAAAGIWYWESRSNGQTTFQFGQVKRGRLVSTVGATGTLQPQEVVDVGAQVAGPIIALGADPNTQSKYVDWGSQVKGTIKDKDGTIIQQGTVLAQIDPQLYEAQVRSTTAAVDSAKADLKLKTATFNQTTADWNRAQKLISNGGILQAEFDQFKAAHEVAQANVSVSTAQIGVAEANQKLALTNLGYTKITSPVDGVVIDRRVNIGQTVVASLSAPSLFLIAKDLSKMEVWATVNEVDVAKIKAGLKVEFTVDALPGSVYHGKVVRQGMLPFRLNATMNQNVVTYTTVVSVDDNTSGKLAPYMTTNLSFIVEDKDNALLVPNAALRWQPAAKQIAPEVRDTYMKLRSKKRGPTDTDADRGFVWVAGDDGFVRYREVRIGLSDTVNTEILSVISGGDLPENSPIIVGEGRAIASSGGTNPFSVQMFKSTKKSE